MIAGIRRQRKQGHQNDVASTIHHLRHRMAAWRLREMVKRAAVM
jgi:hypothetical protein